MSLPPWLREDGGGVVVHLHVQPGAKTTEIVGAHGAALKLRLAAPPVDGKANAALLAYLAERLGVARAKVELLSGASARAKRVRLHGVAAVAVLGALNMEEMG